MHDTAATGPAPRVAAEEAEAYAILPGRLDAGLVILCDHAGNAFPPGYGTLGLDAAEIRRHIAYDIGAAGVTRRLAAALDVPAVMTRYSRLLIDCNRGLDDPTLIMRLSDGATIPGNRALDPAEREQRIIRYYEPYHRAVERVIDAASRAGPAPALLSMHSFTGAWKGEPRPWHAAVLWDKDPRLALPLIERLAAETGILVGDNEPYSGRLVGDTMWKHGSVRGLAHAIVEVRQDLIGDEAGEIEWGDRMTRVVRQIYARPEVVSELGTIRHYGTYTD